MREQILKLYQEGMSPQNIALKLGEKVDDVLRVLVGNADDWRDKRRLAAELEFYLTA